MQTVEDFIFDYEGEQREILTYFHDLLTSLNLVSKIRYRIPFYYGKSWICYLNPVKRNGVELAFIRGNELSNVEGTLDAKNRKQVAGITFYQLSDIAVEAVNEIIHEAILLDETVKYRVGRKKWVNCKLYKILNETRNDFCFIL